MALSRCILGTTAPRDLVLTCAGEIGEVTVLWDEDMMTIVGMDDPRTMALLTKALVRARHRVQVIRDPTLSPGGLPASPGFLAQYAPDSTICHVCEEPVRTASLSSHRRQRHPV